MSALNPLEAFTERMSEEVAEGRIDASDAGMAFLFAQVLSRLPNAEEKLAGACYIRTLRNYGSWPKHDRTTN